MIEIVFNNHNLNVFILKKRNMKYINNQILLFVNLSDEFILFPNYN
jgi:hypothetical protein